MSVMIDLIAFSWRNTTSLNGQNTATFTYHVSPFLVHRRMCNVSPAPPADTQSVFNKGEHYIWVDNLIPVLGVAIDWGFIPQQTLLHFEIFCKCWGPRQPPAELWGLTIQDIQFCNTMLHIYAHLWLIKIYFSPCMYFLISCTILTIFFLLNCLFIYFHSFFFWGGPCISI